MSEADSAPLLGGDTDDAATVSLPGKTMVDPRHPVEVSDEAIPRFTIRPVTDATEAGSDFLTEREIGRGGNGVVMEATQVALRRRVALKRLRSDAASPQAGARLLREAYATGRVQHPNIVPVHALGLDDNGEPLLVMKLIEGTPWSDVVSPLFSTDRASDGDAIERHLRIFVSVCNAIAFAHSRGVIHRDIKPANVMIGSFGEVYVVDWGVAAATRPLDGILLASDSHGLEGTPAYMSPEMARGEAANLDERTDIYLLGATLFELVTGTKPHEADTLEEALERAGTPHPLEVPPYVPTELADIISRATAAVPDDRYADVSSVRDAVNDYLRHRGSLELAGAAHARWLQLKALLSGSPGSSAEDRAALAGEVRFGYRLALHEWPENRRAQEGMRTLVAATIDDELRRGNEAVAAALLAELPDPPPALRHRVEAACANAEARRAEQSKLARVAEEKNFDRHSRARTKMTQLYSAVLGLTIGSLTVARVAGVHQAGYLDGALVVGLFWVTHLLGQRFVVTEALNDVNRRWMAVTTAIPPLVLAVLGLCAWAEIPFNAALALSVAVCAATLTGAIVVLDLGSAVLPLGLLVTAAAIQAWPTVRGASLVIGIVATLSATHRAWARQSTSLAKRRRPTSRS